MSREFIRKLGFFSGFEENGIERLSQLMIERKYRKGMIIFGEGETAEAVFFVKNGRVKISKNTSDGREHIIHIMTGGEVFAEACLFSDVPYPATAEAIDDSEICMIKNGDLEKLLYSHPHMAIEIIKVMAKRLRMVSSQVENLALRDAYGKTASLIIHLLKNQGIVPKDGAVLTSSLSRQDMANMVGLTRETLTRALSRLKSDRAIDIEKDEIKIIDAEKLQDWIY